MKNILILCGGRSAEHEVSLRSAKNVIAALDPKQFTPVLVLVSRSGTWYLLENPSQLENITACNDPFEHGSECALMRQPHYTLLLTLANKHIKVDAAFPLIHGPMGEDGTLQGLLELMSVPFVGSGVMASALGMDKDLLKRALKYVGLPVAPSITLTADQQTPSYEEASLKLGTKTLFIKPCVMGSSVGVSKASSAQEYQEGIADAFLYGTKILIEKYIPCRELECAVLGNTHPKASCVGEIKPTHDFYSYEAKYLDPNGAALIIPASLPEAVKEEVRKLAVKSFQAIECKGMARVDFFMDSDNNLYINELNTIPGFTSISMYPTLWEASGVSYQDLISKLLELAQEEFDIKQRINLSPPVSNENGIEKNGS